MTEKYETQTFYPHAQTEDEQPADAKKAASSLSTTGRLMAYSKQLKNSLNKGLDFTAVLDTLIATNNSEELLTATLRLAEFELDDAYLVFPQQYSRADYYLLFLERLLELHQESSIILNSSDHNKELYHEYPGVNTAGYFVFKVTEENKYGAYYTEVNTGNVLFYLDLRQRILRFNSHDLTNLLVLDYGERFDRNVIQMFQEQFLNIGWYLKKDYGFDVDFNLLDPVNNALYPISDPGVPQQALDRLFIKAAAVNYMLISGPHGEAILDLAEDVQLSLFARDGRWVIAVADPNNEVSFFDVLFKYDFLHDWYLENRNSLEIRADNLYF